MPCPHDKFEETIQFNRCGDDLVVVELRVRCAACRVLLVFGGPSIDGSTAYLPARIPAPPPAPVPAQEVH